MDAKKRQDVFLNVVQKKVGFSQTNWKISKLFGVSNKAILIEGGLQVGVSNMGSWYTPPQGVLLASVLRFPPADEIYFAIIIKQHTDQLFQRLEFMKEMGMKQKADKANKAPKDNAIKRFEEEDNEDNDATDEIEYSDRNNLVVVYLADDGKIYLRNKRFWNSLAIDRDNFGPAAQVDQILFSVYPPEPSAKRNLLVRDFVGYFVDLVGHEKVEEIQPWPDEMMISSDMRRMPDTLSMAELNRRVRIMGGYFIDDLLERYHVSMNHLSHKHFVILSGLSGTGKTTLAKYYAFASHGFTNPSVEDPFFFVCSVRPDWTDTTGIMGYHDVISGKYVVTPFLQALLIATAYKDTPVFVLIDEMNIARAEFYFADVLSAIESGMPLHLHSNSIPLEGSSGEQIPSEIFLPTNLFITGTINIDESTQPLSDKILDRANIIDMSSVNIQGFLSNLVERHLELKNAVDECSKILIQLHGTLTPDNLGFGYRVTEEFIRYYAFVKKTGVLETNKALDSQIVQKILVKLRGSEAQRELLDKLTNILQSYPRSLTVVKDLILQLNELGSFQYLR